MNEPAHSERYLEALQLAASLHRHQRRKGTDVPYVAHVLAVSALVWEDGGGEDAAIAALLHDAVEDAAHAGREPQEVHADIAARFGERVAAIVAGCTDAWTQPKPPWRQRKQAHLERLRSEPDEAVLLVTAADKRHNAAAIVDDLTEHGAAVWERFNAAPADVAWYHRAVADVLVERLPRSRLTRHLVELAAELERRAPPSAGSAPRGGRAVAERAP